MYSEQSVVTMENQSHLSVDNTLVKKQEGGKGDWVACQKYVQKSPPPPPPLPLILQL